MDAARLVAEARRRVGITQAELAARAQTTQSAISRLERGHLSPSVQMLRRLIEACGLELGVSVKPPAPAPESFEHNLRLSPSERLDQLVRTVAFIKAGREAVANDRRSS